MKCFKCGEIGDDIFISTDTRGLAEAHCSNCGSFIKKLKAVEVVEYFEKKVRDTEEKIKEETAKEKEATPVNDMPCKFCRESFFVRYGRLGTVYTPIGAKYCPMCGRKLKPEDKKY